MTSRPGKTAPRLIQDILTYDPQYKNALELVGRNILTDPPPQYDKDKAPERAVPVKNCRHKFLLKQEQSAYPSVGDTPDHSTVYKIASVCQKCRWHLDLIVDFRDDGARMFPCPNGEYALHHFIYREEEGHPEESYKFQCSAPRCPVELRVQMRPPRITPAYKELLTDSKHLKERLAAARRIDPSRTDEQSAQPHEGPDYLISYLRDSLEPSKGKRRIPLLNRKFLKTFGRDCDDMLREFGFRGEQEVEEDGSEVFYWCLPLPPPREHVLEADSQRTLLEDAFYELRFVLSEIPVSTQTPVRNGEYERKPSLTVMERALGCANYQKRPGTRSGARSTEEDHPHYAGLGALSDFADALILFSYARQAGVDFINSTYYFECLHGIAVGRGSTMLEEQVQILASQGQTTRKEVDDAYKYFGIDPTHTSVLTDDIIVGQFKSRLQDSSRALETQTRQMLRIIGHDRGSERIIQEANNAMETYEQALSWLDLEASHSDEFVESMYALKTMDSPKSVDIARQAVKIIAEQRKSKRLQRWLETGTLGAPEMDVAEAYIMLGINDRSAPIDFDVLRVQVEDWNSTPATDQDTRAKREHAFELIRQDRQSNGNGISNSVSIAKPKYPIETWPVGCQNIGNTCYLNSVLQFLFTIKPLRDLVLNFNEEKQEISPEALAKKRVGRSAVTADKVKRAQEFIFELRKLFNLMITVPNTYVRPEQRLAFLALVKDDSAFQAAVEDTTDAKQSSSNLGHIDGAAVVGPMPNPATKPQQEAAQGANGHQLNAENLSTLGESKRDWETGSNNSSTLAEPDVVAAAGDTIDPRQLESDNPEPPSRPPPVPPRPQTNIQTTSNSATEFRALEAVAQQQDAAEILNNIFDLFSCAIKAETLMEDGEQLDIIKKLFYSQIKSARITNGKTATNLAIQDHILTSPGDRNRHLYAALDDEFDLVEVEGAPSENAEKTTKYELMTTIPPVLIINVRRLVFEAGKAKKIEHHVRLDDTIYMDRYLEETKTRSQEELLERHRRQWDLKKKLKALEKRKAELNETELQLSLTEVVNGAADYIAGLQKASSEALVDLDEDPLPSTPDLIDNMRDKAKQLAKEAESLERDMKEIDDEINSIFTDLKDHPYRLHSIFIHRGSASGGHYWIYIHDFQNDVWRKYNDEDVTKVEDLKEIFEQEEKYPATSTGIVYVRSDHTDLFTEAVRRDPAKPPLPPTQPDSDVIMEEAPDAHELKDIEVLDGVGVEVEHDYVRNPNPCQEMPPLEFFYDSDDDGSEYPSDDSACFEADMMRFE